MKKKICVVTGSRAEYGLLYPLIKALSTSALFKLQIIATGTHLSSKFGLTYREIESDGFNIEKRVRILSSGDSAADITKSIGKACAGFAGAFESLKPDMVILLGDRFETFAAAVAAFIANIPIIHLYGGELTEGLIDDAMRHSITKMSFLHFTSTEVYRRRVIQLGEEPKRVFNVGALGIDNIRNINYMSKKELEQSLNFEFGKKSILVTFHPVTLEKNTSRAHFVHILSALDARKDLRVIFTMPNADTDGRIIIKLINDFVRANPRRAAAFTSLGRVRYLSTLTYVDAVLGNSSSGIIETPSFKRPTINIGDRQRGRLKAGNLINCIPRKSDILVSIDKAFSTGFKRKCGNLKNPYGDGRTAQRIKRIIETEHKTIADTKKRFFDIKFNI
jgi:GDP/UDP-N,N'-diacetylbacillosamine 2-epimerase (hydrolysing)